MAHNDGVGDVSTVQTTPPFEIHLAAAVQKVHKMIADHTALTTLAPHRLFLLMICPLSLVSQVLSAFSSNHVRYMWRQRLSSCSILLSCLSMVLQFRHGIPLRFRLLPTLGGCGNDCIAPQVFRSGRLRSRERRGSNEGLRNEHR